MLMIYFTFYCHFDKLLICGMCMCLCVCMFMYIPMNERMHVSPVYITA